MNIFTENMRMFKERLVNRGYDEKVVTECLSGVKFEDRLESLKVKSPVKNKEIPLCLVSTYNKHSPNLNVILKNIGT